jgi:hypothetical protein
MKLFYRYLLKKAAPKPRMLKHHIYNSAIDSNIVADDDVIPV